MRPDEPTTTAATVTTSSDAVTVHAIIEPPHDFVEMHHFGNPDGLHYCPTGFAICTGMHSVQTDCTEVRDFDGDCRLWGQPEPDGSKEISSVREAMCPSRPCSGQVGPLSSQVTSERQMVQRCPHRFVPSPTM